MSILSILVLCLLTEILYSLVLMGIIGIVTNVLTSAIDCSYQSYQIVHKRRRDGWKVALVFFIRKLVFKGTGPS